MVWPRLHPRSGVSWLRERVPADLVAAVGVREISLSLRTQVGYPGIGGSRSLCVDQAARTMRRLRWSRLARPSQMRGDANHLGESGGRRTLVLQGRRADRRRRDDGLDAA
ncbi:DUF6538 domain-containing protein [Methylobacterium crusticola]|uniref:DUF6538 domain-containing protein n=1 Tax=Methylobacterium crusticola TaxID=1697972 RepID=UPI0027E3630D|nr:DUF6538 domain-containing protein [Methylobacterium crusticola]